MELRQLRYFVAVAESEHVRRAAEELRVAQPALSRQIRLLEAELAVPLFERSRQRLRLSPAGRELYADAKRILANVEEMKGHARNVSLGSAGRLRVCYSDAAAWSGPVPESIRAFRSIEPGVDLRLTPMEFPQQMAALEAGEEDVAFAYGLPEQREGFDACLASSEGLLLAVGKHHPLAHRQRLRLRDLRELPFVWIARTRNSAYHDSLLAACAEGGLVPRIVQTASSRATVLSLIAAGLGIGFVLRSVRHYQPGDIVFKEVEDLSLQAQLYLIWKRENTSHALRRFLDIARVVIQAGAVERAAPTDPVDPVDPLREPSRFALPLSLGDAVDEVAT